MTAQEEAIVVTRYRENVPPREIAEELGYAHKTIWDVATRLRSQGVDIPRQAPSAGRIPVEPFKRRFQGLAEQGTTAADIARRLDWTTKGGGADGPRLTRTLGLRPDGASYRQKLTYDMAERLAEALGLDLWEVGLQ